MFRQAITNSSRALRTAPRLAQPLRQQFKPATPIRSFQPLAARWYSEGKDGDADKAAENKDAKSEAAPGDEVAQLKKDLEAKDAEAREWKDKCLRTVADFRNLQDRTQRDVKSARDFAIQKFAKDLVDSVDNLDRALTTVPADKVSAENKESNLDLFNLYDGLKMTEEILIKTLAKHGLERLDPVGEKFNPNEHEATFMTPQPDKENNLVFFVQQKGFKLNGRTLRAAKVGVVKNA